jgi:hypothetical protein
MSSQAMSTAPKPFVFVLMPFKQEFNDIYKYGIKGAAEDVGAYTERVDEQDFTGGILDRVYNQINKADVIVADMTGQNPNVFYEVGYAHALNKIVLLLTQNSDDIPFDLKHRPHIVYGGQIEPLRSKLAQKLRWAIGESATRTRPFQPFGVIVNDTIVPGASTSIGAPTIEAAAPKSDLEAIKLKLLVQNLSPETSYTVSHIYLLTPVDSPIKPLLSRHIDMRGSGRSHLTPIEPVKSFLITENSALPLLYRKDVQLPQIPPYAVEERAIPLRFYIRNAAELDKILNELRTNAPQKEETLILRLHTDSGVQDYPFNLKVTVLTTTPA